MTRDELNALLDAYRDGTLTPREAERLAEAIRVGGPTGQDILKELESGRLLSQALEGTDGESFVRSFFERLQALKSGDEFVRAFQEKIEGSGIPKRPPTTRASRVVRRPRGVPSRPFRAPAIAAAAALLGITLLIVLSTRSGQPVAKQGTAVQPPFAPDTVEPDLAALQEARRLAEAERARLEERRRQEEGRLAEAEREKRRLLDAQRLEEATRQAEAEATIRRDLQALDAARKKADVEVQRAKTAEEDATRPRPTLATVRAATLDEVEGEVWILVGQARTAAKSGQALLAGSGLETTGRHGRAAVRFDDGTRLALGPDTRVRDLLEAGAPARGKRVFLAEGELTAQVKPQPSGRPTVFETPHAEATVLGTTLRLVVDPRDTSATRLEVTEGKVRLKRLTDGKSVEVTGGHFAVAAVGVDMSVKMTAPDQIVLRPRDGKIVGREWKLVKDEAASSGEALEVLRTKGADWVQWIQLVRSGTSGVEFSFIADANKEYSVWVRGACTATRDRAECDMVVLESIGGRFDKKCASMGPLGVTNAFAYDGYERGAGYWWVGGDANGEKDSFAVSITFTRSGRQTLRLHASESPMRVDAIWLSATQKTRPAKDQDGPGAPPRK